MTTALVIGGRSVVGVIVWTPLPAILKTMRFWPGVPLASRIACRNEPRPLSAVFKTVKVDRRSRFSSSSIIGRKKRMRIIGRRQKDRVLFMRGHSRDSTGLLLEGRRCRKSSRSIPNGSVATAQPEDSAGRTDVLDRKS